MTGIPTSLVGSYAQPDWLIDRAKLRGRFPPRVRATELWRVDPQYLEEAQDDATRAGDRRPGARRAGRHHRRRDAPRELLEPLRDRAGGRRRRQPRHGARPLRAPQPGAARGRPDRPPAPGAGARRRVPEARTRAGRPRSRCPARSRCPSRRRTTTTATRPRSAPATPTRCARRSSTCSPPASTSSRSTSRTCRRAREAAREYGLDVLKRATDGLPGHRRRAHLLRLRGDHPRAARGLLVPARAGGHRVRPW